MRDPSELEQKYDYERRMEQLGLAAIKKTRKIMMIFAVIFFAIGLITIVSTWVVSVIFWIVAIVFLVMFFKKGAKMKDMVYVRKVGLKQSRKKGAQGEAVSAPSQAAADGAPVTRAPVHAVLSEDDVPPSEDGKDPDEYGPIKGF